MIMSNTLPMHEKLLDAPAAHPPEGITLDLVHPESMQPGAEIFLWIVFGIATATTVIRLYAQIKISGGLIKEDYVLL